MERDRSVKVNHDCLESAGNYFRKISIEQKYINDLVISNASGTNNIAI